MGERGARAPFYAPPRRKTSAEIISEARAAISAEMKAGESSAAGGLRALRTRRPFTPREPQRTLFAERARTRAPRPPSAFDLKYLSVSEGSEDTTVLTESGASNHDHALNEILLAESQIAARKKPAGRNAPRASVGEGWAALPKLPHLSGRSKPLHRRNTTGLLVDEVSTTSQELGRAISIIRPLGAANCADEGSNRHQDATKLSSNSDPASRRKNFAGGKSLSCDSGAGAPPALGDVAVKHLAVQLPTTHHFHDNFEKLIADMSLLELGDALCARSGDVTRTLALLHAVRARVAAGSAGGGAGAEAGSGANAGSGARRGAGAGSALRDHVLRALYAHIDSDDEHILVAIATAMFTMRVTGAHLAAACKLIFKIARNDKNDHFFKDSNLLELLVEGCARADPLAESECCVYAAGALRFLALEPRLRAAAHRAGALHLAALHLKILNNAKAECPRQVSDQATHALYQMTGALRNLAGGAGGGEAGGAGGEECEAQWARAFVSSGALAELVAALDAHTDRDVLTNVARCLSVLSAQAACCAWLCAGDAAGALLRALAACAARAPLAVRLTYTLGNMAAADHRARLHIYKEEGGVDVLLTILESYAARHEAGGVRDTDQDPDLHLIGSDLGGSDGSNEDVLIKTVRVLANLCLSEAAGRGLARRHAARTSRALLDCLRAAAARPYQDETSESSPSEQAGWPERREELAAAALAALNNVSFYMEAPATAQPPLDQLIDDLCKASCAWARRGCGAAACEAVRALGNLTRGARAAQRAVLEGALDALPAMQRHEDESVRCAAAGVLVNVCGAGVSDAGGAAGDAGGSAARALQVAAAAGDARCAALLARALWNAQSHRPLPPAEARQAAAALASFIDDDSVFEECQAAGPADSCRPADVHHVKFNLDDTTYGQDTREDCDGSPDSLESRTYSIEEGSRLEGDGGVWSSEDLGYSEGEAEECGCAPCRRLAAWEELAAVAVPLLELLRPPRADAAVGTD